jgi:hypothetical protein
MLRNSFTLYTAVTFAISGAVAADNAAPKAGLTAAQIVDKNVAARGGLDAWRAVKTMTLSGKLGAGGNQRPSLPVRGQKPGPEAVQARSAEEVQLPFKMELSRPHKMRFELEFNGQTAVQVFDGAMGWKMRPFLNRRVVEPYTAEELSTASMQADLDGPLVDYQAKGSKIELDGTEKVDGRDNYKIKVTMKSGQVTHVWIDAQSFLETKIDGQPRRLDGVDHPVQVYFRDYRAVNGLQIPFVLETKVLPVGRTAMGTKDPPVPVEKTFIEKVEVNPKLEQAHFTKPEIGMSATLK